jgi:calpain-15
MTTKGSGLVGGHAYSVLDVRQLDDVVVGTQAKVTDFFGAPSGRKAGSPTAAHLTGGSSSSSNTTSTTVRLVQIRNPWGSKEWKGDWSAQSVQWTQKLRQRLPDSWRQGDGTFFMSFEDMLQNFHHMDVCKTQEGWQHASALGSWQAGMREPLQSSRRCYRLLPLYQASYAYVSIIQPKKRANTQSHFWYTDNSLVLLQRRIGTEEAWSTVGCSLSGVQRSTTLEVFLDPQKYEYTCLSYSCAPRSNHTPFRITVYSGQKVQVEETLLDATYATAALEGIHKHLLKVQHKLIYPLCQNCILVCSQQSNGCYFVAMNASDYHVSLRLTVETPPKDDIQVLYRGALDDTHGIPAGCQRILLFLSGSGKSSMTATQCPFRYASSVEQQRCSTKAPLVSRQQQQQQQLTSTSLGGSIGLTLAGELLATQAASHVALEGCRGHDILDTFAWIPQLGASSGY